VCELETMKHVVPIVNVRHRQAGETTNTHAGPPIHLSFRLLCYVHRVINEK